MNTKFHYLPEDTSNLNDGTSDIPKNSQIKKAKYACPCCGFLTFPVPQNEALAFVCPVCFWENDLFIRSDDESSDENHGLTLSKANENFRKFGAVRSDFLKYVRKPFPDEMPQR